MGWERLICRGLVRLRTEGGRVRAEYRLGPAWPWQLGGVDTDPEIAIAECMASFGLAWSAYHAGRREGAAV